MPEISSSYQLSRPAIIVVMGVSGCGKTTIGKLLAEALQIPFYDADDFHPPGNREKMRNDIPLTDDDRWPWIDEITSQMPAWATDGGAVLACSALKKVYRDKMRLAANIVHFVYLQISRNESQRRLSLRADHDVLLQKFDQVVDGQFRDLEEPEHALTVTAHTPKELLLSKILYDLQAQAVLNLKESQSSD